VSITFTNVHKTLRQKNEKTKVFEDVNVEFAGDRITGILAPPGSGKSTAVQLTTGKIRPDIGRVRRESLASFPVAGGGVFNGALTGRENLAFLCRVFGFDPVPIIRFIVDFAELGKAIDKPVKLLNRDERTRLFFTSCYAIPFETYIIDETLIGGRGTFRDRCVELVEERMQTSGFLIFTSSPLILRRYCNAFCTIDRLKITPMETADDAIASIGEERLKYGAEEVEGLDATADDTSEVNPR
jgi:capsular polysaccharide transport system ATP-binding protein